MATEILVSKNFPQKLRGLIYEFVDEVAPYVESYPNGNAGTSEKMARELMEILDKYGIPYEYTRGTPHVTSDVLIIYKADIDYSPITPQEGNPARHKYPKKML